MNTRWLGFGVVMVLGGCGDDDSGSKADTTASATDTSASSATDTGTSTTDAAEDVAEPDTKVQGCPMEGTWKTFAVYCDDGTFHTPRFTSVYSEMVFTITAAADGCNIHTLFGNGTCTQEADGTLTSVGGIEWSYTSPGVSSCTPEACTFAGGAITCTLGTGAGESRSFYDLDRVEGELWWSTKTNLCGNEDDDMLTEFVMSRQ